MATIVSGGSTATQRMSADLAKTARISGTTERMLADLAKVASTSRRFTEENAKRRALVAEMTKGLAGFNATMSASGWIDDLGEALQPTRAASTVNRAVSELDARLVQADLGSAQNGLQSGDLTRAITAGLVVACVIVWAAVDVDSFSVFAEVLFVVLLVINRALRAR